MHTLKRLFRWLTAPHPSITDSEQQRQSSLLVVVLMVVFITMTLVVIRTTSANLMIGATPREFFFITPFLMSIVGIWWLNRKGYYLTAARVLIVVSYIGLVGYALQFTPVLVYMVLLVLLAALFLTETAAIITALVAMGTVLFFALSKGFLMPQSMTVGTIMDYSIIGLPLVIAYIHHRGVSERDRRRALEAANERLRTSEAGLEQHVAERTRDLKAARDEIEKLYYVSQRMNMAQTFIQIVEAISDQIDDLNYNIALAVYENYDKEGASYFEAIALRPAGTPQVIGMSQRFEARLINPWVEAGVFVVEDVATAHAQMGEAGVTYYQQHNVGSMMLVGMRLGDRILGTLNLTLPYPNVFTERDRRFIRAVADVAAAAVERVRLYNQQVETAEQLRAADRIKSQFLASMSHELRTPLNAILNFTEFVSLGMLGSVNPKQQDALNKALDSGRHLLSLINDVLDMTKIEAGMMTLFVEDNIDLTMELASVIETTHTLLKEKPITFNKDIDRDLPTIVGDRRRIRQILLNLLSNAAKFTEAGSITLSVKKRADDILFAVIDTGPGIAQREQGIIFEPFKQTDTGIRHANGTGLGLPISKRLVEAHGGRLWLESDVGEGAAFYFTIPIKSERLQAQLIMEA